jgi:hypothetical protein
MTKKANSRLKALEDFRFTEGQHLWDKLPGKISKLEFQDFERKQWRWLQTWVTPFRLGITGYLLLIAQVAFITKGNWSSISRILLEINPINAFLSTAATLVLGLAPLALLTREYRDEIDSYPKNLYWLVNFALAPALLMAPILIDIYFAIIVVLYFVSMQLSKKLAFIMKVRIWCLFNLPSLATGLILMGMFIVVVGAPVLPRVLVSQDPYKNMDLALVNQSQIVTVVEITSGTVISDSQEKFGQIQTCIPAFGPQNQTLAQALFWSQSGKAQYCGS